MAQKYVRKNKWGDEMYPKTVAEQVVYSNGQTQEEFNNNIKFIEFDRVVDVPVEDIKHVGSVADGVLVFNKVNNQFLWAVGTSLTSEYFDASSRNENVGSFVKQGRTYTSGNRTYIGTKNGLSEIFKSEVVEV